MVRVMTFQSSLTWIGITGWILRMSCVPLLGPTLKLMLFWNGRLIRSAIGFWSFSARSDTSLDAAARCIAAGSAVVGGCCALAVAGALSPMAKTSNTDQIA